MQDGKIAFVGSDADAERFIGPRTRVIDLGGRMLLPAILCGGFGLLLSRGAA